MPLTVRVRADSWSGADPRNVEAVALSAASTLDALDDSETIGITLIAASRDEGPLTFSKRHASGDFVVRLATRGTVWAQIAYQFAHEYCHVLADPTTWHGYGDQFAWLEEVLCETASLFALRRMAAIWATDPPYPNWFDYALKLSAYENAQRGGSVRAVPAGMSFRTWLADHLPFLQADACRRGDNTVVAGELLPIFEANAHAWRAVRSLHAWDRGAAEGIGDFMREWSEACVPEQQQVVREIAGRLGA